MPAIERQRAGQNPVLTNAAIVKPVKIWAARISSGERGLRVIGSLSAPGFYARDGIRYNPRTDKGIADHAMTIFVSIAAYRDPELGPTIVDCLQKARDPGALRFGVCWQYGDGDAAPAILADPRIQVIDVPWHKSAGACWARAEIMRLWRNEDFFLQLDSHHRFTPDWDARLIDQMARTNRAKSVLSAHPAGYDPLTGVHDPAEPMQIDLHDFGTDGIPTTRPHVIPDWENTRQPVPARFTAAGFLFAPGSFIRDVPYDPGLYFMGEEIMLAIRAFTNGYDLFHPAEHILWHEYTRPERPKHWEDHVPERGAAVDWRDRDRAARRKVSAFLSAPTQGVFGMGNARSLKDYEKYTGLNFARRAATNAAFLGQAPPGPDVPANWARDVQAWRVRIVLDRAAMPKKALNDPLGWHIACLDKAGDVIFQEHAPSDRVARLLEDGTDQITIEGRLATACEPGSWFVRPMARDGTSLTAVTGRFDGLSMFATT